MGRWPQQSDPRRCKPPQRPTCSIDHGNRPQTGSTGWFLALQAQTTRDSPQPCSSPPQQPQCPGCAPARASCIAPRGLGRAHARSVGHVIGSVTRGSKVLLATQKRGKSSMEGVEHALATDTSVHPIIEQCPPNKPAVTSDDILELSLYCSNVLMCYSRRLCFYRMPFSYIYFQSCPVPYYPADPCA